MVVYTCGSTDHLTQSCKKKTKSAGLTKWLARSTDARTKGIKPKENPLDCLQPNTDDVPGVIKTVQIQDKGSRPRVVLEDNQGVLIPGLIDYTCADITIMGAELFKQVALVAWEVSIQEA